MSNTLLGVIDRVQVKVRGVRGDAVLLAHLSKEEQNTKEKDLRQDPESVGVSQTTLPSLNSHDGSIRLDDTESQGVSESVSDPVVDVDLPLTLWDTPWFGVMDWVDTSRKVELSCSLLTSGDCGLAEGGRWKREEEGGRTTDDWALGSELG